MEFSCRKHQLNDATQTVEEYVDAQVDAMSNSQFLRELSNALEALKL
jgi:hypothetical protein